MIKTWLAGGLLMAGAAWAGPAPADSGGTVPVYQNKERKLYETPLFHLQAGEALDILERDGDKIKIAAAGKTGWVEKKALEGPAGTQHLWMKELTVMGFLDNPEPIYILDFDHSDLRSIRMNRDFVYDPAFMGNIDRENFEWENEIYYYKDAPFTPQAVSSVFVPLANR